MLALFTLTIFLGALLLFLVQPMVARMLLPGLGGSPAVWNTCMVFFQAALLAGYAYAHWGSSRLGPRRLALVHPVVLALPAIALLRWGPAPAPAPGASPIPWLLATLALTIGLPFLVVATTAPLLQRWFAETDHPSAKDPYFLYAASNAGSLLALIGYPALIEWLVGLDQQRRLWSIAYIVLAVLVAACGFVAIRRTRGLGSRPSDPAESPPHPGPQLRSTAIGDPSLTPSPPHTPSHPLRERLLWVALAAVPSSLMLGVTQYLSTDVAAVPLLWVAPLAIYLLTFVLAFSGRRLPVASVSKLLPIAVTCLALGVLVNAKHPVWVLFVLHLLTLFLAATLCHTRLALSRPPASRLTEFYLLIALGGVLGGAFNALLAPMIFRTVTEYPIALVLACLFRVPRARGGPGEARRWAWGDVALDAAFPLLLISIALATDRTLDIFQVPYEKLWWRIFGCAVPAVVCYLAVGRPVRFAAGIGALFLIATLHAAGAGQTLHRERTFFGVYHVTRDSRSTMFIHGTTMHGEQFNDPERRHIPLGYYHPDGPIGHVFQTFGGTPLFDRAGLVGLGAGSLAAYGRPGQRMTFFEIDPAVARIAENPAWFTYLAGRKGEIDMLFGDGRVSLRDRAAEGEFGLIVLDAFTSDAIPVHLITREALALYVSRLKPHGLVAFHVSNRYVELTPVIARMAEDLGLVALARTDQVDPEETYKTGRAECTWVLVARTHDDLGPLLHDPRWHEVQPGTRAPRWTDDYSNIFTVFDWD